MHIFEGFEIEDAGHGGKQDDLEGEEGETGISREVYFGELFDEGACQGMHEDMGGVRFGFVAIKFVPDENYPVFFETFGFGFEITISF